MIFGIGSVYLGTSYLIQGSGDSFEFKIVRLILALIAQVLRLTFLSLMIERIIATVYLEKYTQKISHFCLYLFLASLTYLIAMAFLVPNVTCKLKLFVGHELGKSRVF